MELMVRGRFNKQTAGDLGVAEKTIKAHRARVMSKMAARSLAELVQFAVLIDAAGQDSSYRTARARKRPSVSKYG